MVYVNIILLLFAIIGIIYGTVRLVMARKYVLATLMTIMVSWWVVFIMLQCIGCNLQYLGIASEFMVKHIPYSTQRFTIRALTYKAYGPLLVLDLIGLTYAMILIILPKLGARRNCKH